MTVRTGWHKFRHQDTTKPWKHWHMSDKSLMLSILTPGSGGSELVVSVFPQASAEEKVQVST